MAVSTYLGIGVTVVFALTGGGARDAIRVQPPTDDDAIVVTGKIKQVTLGAGDGKVHGEILVDVDRKGEYRFLVRSNTRVSLPNKQPGRWGDLKVNQRVRITFSGIVAPSSPPQAAADGIVIEAQADAPSTGGTAQSARIAPIAPGGTPCD
jgi:hypothetical protein